MKKITQVLFVGILAFLPLRAFADTIYLRSPDRLTVNEADGYFEIEVERVNAGNNVASIEFHSDFGISPRATQCNEFNSVCDFEVNAPNGVSETWGKGENGIKKIRVGIVNDSDEEPNETFAMQTFQDWTDGSMLDEEFWILVTIYNDDGTVYNTADFNTDGCVDATDLNEIGLNWRKRVLPQRDGDATGNGYVDAADLNELGLQWRQGCN
ncbi:hypothetical protein BVX98_01780 [bacterium F11]|nr:hypothetical protein BVX98_01780 [bacterium F11]